MLAAICARARSLGVAGTHGKTTTTSMLMLILAEAGLAPSFIVGGDVHDAGTGGQWSGSEWLVVEADESDATHVELPLAGTLVLNVEIDFLDHYGTFEALVDSFDQYLAQVAGPKVLCADDPICRRLAVRHGATTYGRADDADVRGWRLVRAGARSASPSSSATPTAVTPGWETSTCRCVASTTWSTPPVPSPWRWRWACRSRRASKRSPDSVVWPADSTSGESMAAPPSSTITPTCLRRSPP